MDRLKSCQAEGGGVSLQCQIYLPKVGMRLVAQTRAGHCPLSQPHSPFSRLPCPFSGLRTKKTTAPWFCPPPRIELREPSFLRCSSWSCGLCGLPEAGQGAERIRLCPPGWGGKRLAVKALWHPLCPSSRPPVSPGHVWEGTQRCLLGTPPQEVAHVTSLGAPGAPQGLCLQWCQLEQSVRLCLAGRRQAQCRPDGAACSRARADRLCRASGDLFPSTGFCRPLVFSGKSLKSSSNSSVSQRRPGGGVAGGGGGGPRGRSSGPSLTCPFALVSQLQAQKLRLAYTRSCHYGGSLPDVNQIGCGLAELQVSGRRPRASPARQLPR